MVEAGSIKFLKWDSLYEKEKPFQIFTNLLPDSQDRRKSNLAWDEREVLVEDLRGQERDFQMDASGFATCQLPGFADLSDPEAIREEYLPAVEDMLRRELDDVGTVVVFDWRIRSSSISANDGGTAGGVSGGRINYSDLTQPLLPVNFAHTDTSPISVIRQVQNDFPRLSERILRQRIRSVNVWKPLAHPVSEWPLAVCDGATVEPQDLVETDSIRQGITGTAYYAKYNAGQRWYFLKNQAPDEALVFKHFDSEPHIRAPRELSELTPSLCI